MDLTKYTRIAFQFSGGKDSYAALKLLEPWWDRLTVFTVLTGDMPHEQEAFVARVLMPFKHVVVARSDSGSWRVKHGYPVDILPWEATGAPILGAEQLPRMVLFTKCCMANLWSPMADAIEVFDPEVIIRGQKKDDTLRGQLRDGDEVDGVIYHYPLENWTDQDVLDFLGDDLPPGYDSGLKGSIDCKSCTAYAHEAKARMAYLEKDYPIAVDEVRQVHWLLTQAMVKNLEKLNG